jgi:3-deoxy-manno-octulosonate cytidylyltransferase (CMP-KDO synthetase)
VSVEFHVVIPARFASTRLPGKMLKDLHGRPMIWHVVERAAESGASSVHVATDDTRISDALVGSGCEVVMTSPRHGSGTERLAEACERIGFDAGTIIVNVQGDEPLIPSVLISQCANLLARNPSAAIATLCHRIHSPDEVLDPNVVKVVFDISGRALWFSRAPIPFERGGFERDFGQSGHAEHWRHIGIYAYSAAAIARYVALAPCAEERSEVLEQLRALHHGEEIRVAPALEMPGPGIDTEQDLEQVRRQMAQSGRHL